MLQKIPNWLKNKYAITILVFLIFLLFFDQNNILTQYSYRDQLDKLETEKEYFNQEITKTRKELEELTKNPATLEKFAREKYYMKKENEEVFVFTDKKSE
ncbi:MAG: septum formation initiator family protein [Vicingaceae bacterium]|nr:septum formation initiator family protein [Vicingaceae bacterium]